MRPTIQILDPDLIPKILAEAKQILAELGIEVRGKPLRARLLDHGLKTTPDGRVLFPQDVVEKAITSTPRGFTFYNRDGEPHSELGGDNVHFVPGSSGLSILDHRTGDVRLANTADFVEYIRLCDGLEHIAYPATAFSTNNDIEAQVSDAWRLYLVLTNTRKPVVSGAFTEHGVPRMAEMMQLFRHDRADLLTRPMSIFTITATGNFRYSEDSCQNLLDCVEAGIPVEIVPVTIMGLIAPVTLFRAAVFHVVDVLAGLVMGQIVKPGAPILFGGAPAAFHMKAATSPMMAIEALRLDLMYVAVAKHLGLPTQSYMAFSESKLLDAQAGAETFGSALLAALAGVNSVSGPGMLDYLLVFSLPKLVFDNEACGQVFHFIREMKTPDDFPTINLARQLLDDAHLLTSPHTLQHWQKELYLPGMVYDRLNRDTWSKAGAWTLEQRAVDEVEKRLAAYEPLETDLRVVAELQRIIQSGMTEDTPLPHVPKAKKPKPNPTGAAPRRARRHVRG
ncbi:MAG TPA: trimethylamine methyltransferase family protein [Anaerolineales bacterium]|nr:trimethylamine methyltransferase family protein [Anaerolineales bacterium]